MSDTSHSNEEHKPDKPEVAPAPENSHPDMQAPFSPGARPATTSVCHEAAYPPPDARERVEPDEQESLQPQPQPQDQDRQQSPETKHASQESQLPFAHAPLTYAPPTGHNPAAAPAAQPQPPFQDPQELAALNRARSCATVGIVCGIMSLFVGGVLLSALALVFSFISYRASSHYINDKNSAATPVWQEQRLRIRLALIVSICAFVLSVLSLIFLYPVIFEFLQANGFDSLPLGSGSSGGESAGGGAGGVGDSGSSGGGSSGSSVWG